MGTNLLLTVGSKAEGALYLLYRSRSVSLEGVRAPAVFLLVGLMVSSVVEVLMRVTRDESSVVVVESVCLLSLRGDEQVYTHTRARAEGC